MTRLQQRHRTRSEGMAAWSARNHGYGWQITRERYWHKPPRWRRTRCYWCRRAHASTGRRWATSGHFELNHLTYMFSKEHAGPLVVALRALFGLQYWDTGQVPLCVVRPMCGTCHRFETWLTRRYDRGHRRAWAHGIVTFTGRQVINAALWVPVLWLVLSTL